MNIFSLHVFGFVGFYLAPLSVTFFFLASFCSFFFFFFNGTVLLSY